MVRGGADHWRERSSVVLKGERGAQARANMRARRHACADTPARTRTRKPEGGRGERRAGGGTDLAQTLS